LFGLIAKAIRVWDYPICLLRLVLITVMPSFDRAIAALEMQSDAYCSSLGSYQFDSRERPLRFGPDLDIQSQFYSS
jgi:hypothetical protein